MKLGGQLYSFINNKMKLFKGFFKLLQILYTIQFVKNKKHGGLFLLCNNRQESNREKIQIWG